MSWKNILKQEDWFFADKDDYPKIFRDKLEKLKEYVDQEISKLAPSDGIPNFYMELNSLTEDFEGKMADPFYTQLEELDGDIRSKVKDAFAALKKYSEIVDEMVERERKEEI